MQEQGVGLMTHMGADIPLLWATSQVKRKGRQATDLQAASSAWANELAAFERAQQAQARSMMVLIHELRAPASTSKSMIATLRFLNSQDTQLDSFLAKIEDRMDQLLDLVNDILDLSQAKCGNPLGQTAVLDLVTETRAVCKPYQEEAAAKGLATSVELPESPVRVRMAGKAYRIIVSNLVSNAVKYTATGSVRVTLRQKGTWAVLTVRDTGIGIPPGEVPFLFTEFFRASNARASRTLGTGLGLAAVKALVEGCHGQVELHSQENGGSMFTVRLPLYKAGTAQEAKSRLCAEGRFQ
jgi:signal transduction histidine kinase